MFERQPEPASYVKPRNMIIEWESPQVRVTRRVFDMGVKQASPEEYISKYSTSLLDVTQMPEYVRDIRPTTTGLVLAADVAKSGQFQVPQLEGDVFALSLIDLEREGLGEYRGFFEKQGFGKGNE